MTGAVEMGGRGLFNDPVLVLCNGRSGSTLLRFLLDGHPDLACPPETNVPALCAQLATVWSLIEGAPLSATRGDEPPVIPDAAIRGVRDTMDRMMESYLARRGKKRYCDKSLGTAVTVALLAGAAGTGKTTLAVHTAHLMRRHFPDGQLYADLLGADERSAAPGEILASFLRDMGVHPTRIPAREAERAAHYRSLLTGRRVLVVLDGARDAAQVRPLLPGSASCAVLVTGRSRMPDLAGSHLIELDLLEPAEARELFTAIVGRHRVEAEPEATEEVLGSCGGLPLAIRIAGARLAARGGWTIRTMADRLGDERRRLDELRTGNLAVRASFEVGLSGLPAPASADGLSPVQAFAALGLWQGTSIELPAAAVLLGRPGEAARDVLEVLVDAQLMLSPAPDRYHFHDLLRVYAAGRAAEEMSSAQRHDAVRRLLTWYVHSMSAVVTVLSPHREPIPLPPLEASVRPLSFPAAAPALAWCEAERANLVAATRQAASYGMHDIAWKLPVAALSFFNRRACWSEWIATHQIGLASARLAGDPAGEASVLDSLGMVYGRLRMPDTFSCYEKALSIRYELGDELGAAKTTNNLADSLLRQQRPAEARDLLHRALDLHRRAGRRLGEAVSLNNLGEAHLCLGHRAEARRYLEEARGIFQALGEMRGESYALHNLGRVFLDDGNAEQALECLRRAQELRATLSDHVTEAETLVLLGRAQAAAGAGALAQASWRRAIFLLEEIGDEVNAARVRTELGGIGPDDAKPAGPVLAMANRYPFVG